MKAMSFVTFPYQPDDFARRQDITLKCCQQIFEENYMSKWGKIRIRFSGKFSYLFFERLSKVSR